MKSNIYRVNLFKILPKETKIILDESERLRLFNILKAKLNTLTDLSRRLNVDIRNMSRYCSGEHSIPLELFIKLIELAELEIDIFQNKIKMKIFNTNKEFRIGPFLDINADWVYVSELIRGDGHITKKLWDVCFINKEKALIDFVRNFFLKIGISKKRISLVRKDAYYLKIRSMLLSYILIRIFDIPAGAKGEMKLPEFIKTNENFSISAVRGFFDAEGSVAAGLNKNHKHLRYITMAMSSLNYIKDIKLLLNKLKINSCLYTSLRNKNKLYILNIYHKTNIKQFSELIKPIHPRRSKLIKVLLESYTDRMTEGSLRKPILEILKKGKKRRIEIAELLQLPKHKLSHHLKWLKNRELIGICSKVYSMHGSYFEYKITEKGLEYLLS